MEQKVPRHSQIPELTEAVCEKYPHDFFANPNGALYCTANEQYYEVDEVEIDEESFSDESNVAIFLLTAPTGIKGILIVP
jgi:hypothetical protein